MASFLDWARRMMTSNASDVEVLQSPMPVSLMNIMANMYPEPVAVLNRATDTIVWGSPGLMMLSGRAGEELVKMKPEDFIRAHFASPDEVIALYAEKIADAQINSRFISPEGEKYVQALWMRLPEVEKGADYFLLMLRDITEIELMRQELLQYNEELQQQIDIADRLYQEREKMYLELQEKSEWLRLISTATAYSNTMKFILTPEGTIVWVNRFFERASGWSAAELIGKNVRDIGGTFAHLLPSPQAAPSEDTLIINHFHRAPFTEEIFAYDRNGNGYWMLITLAPIPDEAGNITHYIGALINIHRKKQREEELRLFRQEIQESLSYAARIQRRFLSSPEILKGYFSDYAVWHKPMIDIGGDFYYYETIKDGAVIAMGDCTGHGIPAALLSIYATTSLRFALQHYGTDLESVYHRLKQDIREVFARDGNMAYEGFEVGILYYQPKSGKAKFIGAGRPLWVLRGGTLVPMMSGKGDISVSLPDAPTQHEAILMIFSLNKGDRLYLFSDGITDQLNKESKRFSTSRLQKLVRDSHPLPLQTQVEFLKNSIQEWANGAEQTDDFLLIALEV
ncbi:MAG: SpoIIE family protein phosphatase [Bacteroidia bacterium]|nr:SpoIIE family protein phosphatase [Bacteroidia bacterium]